MKEITFEMFEEMIGKLFDPQFSFDPRLLESWTSMQSMIVVAAIDENYDVLISHEELKTAQSLEALFATVQSKIQ